MKRGQFLRELGLSSSALMAFYCMGTLSSCSKANDPQPATTTPTTPVTPTTPTNSGLTGNAQTNLGKINFTLDLTSANYKGLKTEGGYVTPGDIIVANTKGGTLVALSKSCTHQGTTVLYQLNLDNFYCPNHGSQFSDNGAVVVGPAAAPLKKYIVTVSTDGNSVTVTE